MSFDTVWTPLPQVVVHPFRMIRTSIDLFQLLLQFNRKWGEIRAQGGDRSDQLTQALTVGGIWTLILFGSGLLLLAAALQLVIDYWPH